ncbi:MAG: response regulator [Kofleriaceae bacterium]
MRPTLIIADDNADMRNLVRSTLHRDFPDVIEAADGRQLYWQLLRSSIAPTVRAQPKFVVVADVCMPSFSGLDVLDAWHDGSALVPAVVITSFPDDEVRERVRQLGGILLAKPFTRTSLRDAVAEAARRIPS